MLRFPVPLHSSNPFNRFRSNWLPQRLQPQQLHCSSCRTVRQTMVATVLMGHQMPSNLHGVTVPSLFTPRAYENSSLQHHHTRKFVETVPVINVAALEGE
jgi:hypothetical protein